MGHDGAHRMDAEAVATLERRLASVSIRCGRVGHDWIWFRIRIKMRMRMRMRVVVSSEVDTYTSSQDSSALEGHVKYTRAPGAGS